MSVSRSFFGRGGGEGRDEEDARVSTRGGSRPGGGLDPRTREGRKTFVRGVPTRIEKPFAPCGSSRGRGRGRAGGNPARARGERAAPPRPSRRGPRVRFGSAFALKESRHRRRGIRGGAGRRGWRSRARGEKNREKMRARRASRTTRAGRGGRASEGGRGRDRARARTVRGRALGVRGARDEAAARTRAPNVDRVATASRRGRASEPAKGARRHARQRRDRARDVRHRARRAANAARVARGPRHAPREGPPGPSARRFVRGAGRSRGRAV